MKVLLADLNRCNGCYNCQIACKDEHVGNDWSPVAKPQPDTGQFWLKVTEVVQGSVPKVRVRYMLDMCGHCGEAPCLKVCGSGAVYRREDGIVIIDPDRQVFISHTTLHSNVDYSAYEGFPVQGWPVCTIARGEIIVNEGKYTGSPGRGKFLSRSLHGRNFFV